MKKCFAIMLSFLLLISIILQGCTTMPDQPYLKKETSEATPLKVIRYETPRLKVYTTGGLVGSIVTGAVLFGLIGAGLTYVIYEAVSTEPANPDVNDFGKLVMDGFVERSKKEIPNWPTMVVQKEFAVADAPIDNTSYTLTLKVGDVKINAESGLSVDTIITMKDKEGKVVWEKGYWYDPVLFNRLSTFDDLKADKFKKLNEELAFAADKTVSNFITHFNKPFLTGSYSEEKYSPKERNQPEKKAEPTVNVNPYYSSIRGIVLKNGNAIEGQIISVNAETVKIRTKDGRILSYSFVEDIQSFIK